MIGGQAWFGWGGCWRGTANNPVYCVVSLIEKILIYVTENSPNLIIKQFQTLIMENDPDFPGHQKHLVPVPMNELTAKQINMLDPFW